MTTLNIYQDLSLTPEGETKLSCSLILVQPVGNCDGSREYAEDTTKEDYRGAKLAERCPGCRACS